MNQKQELQGFFQIRIVQLAALTLLLATLGTVSLVVIHAVQDPDVWWHLKVGDWIRQNHAVPHNGLFSRTAADRPWVAYSWGYEVQLSLFVSALGLFGIGLNGLALTVLTAVALFWSTHRLSRNFWLSVTLTGTACAAFLYSLYPRPVFFSMPLFAVLITVLLEFQRTRNLRLLYWLPPIFLMWANLHIQFVYGLSVLGLFVFLRAAQQLIEPRFERFSLLESPQELPLLVMWGVLAACVIAGCIGPYGVRLYQVVLEYGRAKVTYSMITELQAPAFTGINQFIGLLLAATAFFAVGWRRRLDIFKISLLVIAAVFAYRTYRDAWFLGMVSAAIIADTLRTEDGQKQAVPFNIAEIAGVCVAVVFCLFLTARNADFSQQGLERQTARSYPVNAANFLRQTPVPGPIFNSFDWGGFLTWYMPQYPVSIDGRNDLYGDELDSRLYGVEVGTRPYTNEPLFTEAKLILLQVDVPLAALLHIDPAYREIYRDRMTVIYVRM